MLRRDLIRIDSIRELNASVECARAALAVVAASPFLRTGLALAAGDDQNTAGNGDVKVAGFNTWELRAYGDFLFLLRDMHGSRPFGESLVAPLG
jgi:hypothetical protein